MAAWPAAAAPRGRGRLLAPPRLPRRAQPRRQTPSLAPAGSGRGTCPLRGGVARAHECGGPLTWDRLAYESQPFAKKVASALALFAPLGTKLAHSARVRTIKHRLERWKPLECPRRAAPTAAKECFGERTTKPVTQKKRSARVASAVQRVARRHCACGPHSGCLSNPESGGVQKCARVTFPAHPLSRPHLEVVWGLYAGWALGVRSSPPRAVAAAMLRHAARTASQRIARMRASQSPAVALRTARARTLARKAGGGKRKQPPPGVPLGAGGPTRVEVHGGGVGA